MTKNSSYQYPVNIFDTNSTYGIAASTIDTGMSVLDLGCNDGRLLDALRTHKQCPIYGMDYNASAISVAQKNNIPSQVLDLNNPGSLRQHKHQYDRVLLLDVIEHLQYPCSVFEHLPSLLTDKGKCIVSIPSLSHIDVAIKILLEGWQYQDDGLLDRTHIHFYSLDELQKIFLANELYLERVGEVVVPPGMANLISDPKQVPALIDVIAPFVDMSRATTFQSVLVFSNSKQKRIADQNAGSLAKPSSYVFQRISVVFQLLLHEIKSKF